MLGSGELLYSEAFVVGGADESRAFGHTADEGGPAGPNQAPIGQRADVKKAVVTLEAGQTIDVTTGL